MPNCLINFTWEKFDRPELAELREKFRLVNIIGEKKDEFSRMLALKDWVNKVLPHGNNPKRQYRNSIEIFEDAKKGEEFYCSHFSLVFLQCATALGWYSRKLGIDYNHQQGQEEMHHGITDIWSNKFKKWFAVDPLHNLHFEKNGLPLNSYEVRAEFLKNKAKDVIGIIGDYEKKINYSSEITGYDQPSNYFWFFILIRNNFFEDPDMYDGKSLLWTDEFNKDKIWYKGGGKKGESKPHPMYESQFIKTNDFNLCFPAMGEIK